MDDALKQHLVLAREHYEKREYDRAEYHLNEVLKHTQSYADVYNMLGVIDHDRGDFQEARKHFETARKINPNYTEASLNLAVTYNDLGLYADARRIYEQMRERSAASPEQIDPFSRGKLANLHAEVAQAYADFGLFGEAAGEYRKALALCPQFADLRVRLGNVLRDMGELEAARQEYEEALRHNPRYAPARVLLGIALFSMGRRGDAEAAWQAAVEQDPDNKSAQMYLRMVRGAAMRSSMPPDVRPSASPTADSTGSLKALTLAETNPEIHAPPPSKDLEDDK
jgi:tetratricopeptide (TPR) repeat protein